MIIGTDYHPSFQPIAFIDTETRDYGEQRLQHRKERKGFTAILQPVKCGYGFGMEAVNMPVGLNDHWRS